MLFKPRNCPNCGIKWQDHVSPGRCDLCGYDLSIGGQAEPPLEKTARVDSGKADRTVRRAEFGRAGYRPLMPGIEVRDPGGLLSGIDPQAISELSGRMGRLLGRQAERGGTGRLNTKRNAKAMEIVRAMQAAVAEWNAVLLLDSRPGDLPIRLTVIAEGQRPDDVDGRPVAPESARPPISRAVKILRVILFLGALAAWFLIQYMERK